MNIEDLDSLEDVEHCVIYYNQAVLLYHLKQYSAALKIMHKIFSFIEPMGKKLNYVQFKILARRTACGPYSYIQKKRYGFHYVILSALLTGT